MKKAQILSAIALAFALGVVAPVAGANAAPVARNGSIVAETATKAEVNAAIAKIEGYAAYKNFLALNEAVTAATGVTAPAADTITDAIKAIDTNYTPAANITLKDAIADAKKVENYGAWSNIIEAMNNDSTSVSDDAKRDTLINAIKVVFPTYSAGQGSTYTSVKADVTTDVAEIKAKYDVYNPLVEAVNTANKALTVEANLRNALIGVGKSAAEVNAAADIAALTAMANAYPGYTAYSTLITAVANAKKSVTTDASEANKTTIEGLDTNLKAATKAATGTEVSLAELANGTTGDGNNNDDGDGDGEGNKAPDTGVLANAEGSASTTVAMVAGIATALTAAGAGVVAYRNARRSTRK